MTKFQGAVKVGLRDRETHRLVAVYPHSIEGDDKEIEDKVKFWYYQQNCSAEDELRNYYVDALNEKELKSLR